MKLMHKLVLGALLLTSPRRAKLLIPEGIRAVTD